ncbi:MAG: DUF2400 family protein, partial [Bacteroidetes bacterium]|nr:DUF2400 family protein [Bacteroidota bacterium]
MDRSPFQFIQQHQPKDLDRFSSFKHRTFQPIDICYIIFFLQQHFEKNKSLEAAFIVGKGNMENRLNAFHDDVRILGFLSGPHCHRTFNQIQLACNPMFLDV